MSNPTGRKATTEQAPVAEVTDPAKKQKALAEARSAAVSTLVNEYRARFNELVAEEAKKRGVAWKPKPTAEEKALAEAKALLEAHPDLAGKLGLVEQEPDAAKSPGDPA